MTSTSNSSNGSQPSSTVVERQNKLDKYDGLTKDIRVQTWLRLYEVHTDGRSSAERSRNLLYNLKGIALEWYGDEIAGSNYTWDQIKDRMTRRFGISTATPLIDAQRRRLKREETVEQYFQDKMRLLRQAGLTESQMVDQLTEGLPFQWKLTLTASHPVDTNAWVQVAQKTESHFKSRPQLQKPFVRKPTARTLAADTNQNESPPQCQYCRRLNIQVNHWHARCPNNPRANSNQNRNNNRNNDQSRRNNNNNRNNRRNEQTETNANVTTGDDNEQTVNLN